MGYDIWASINNTIGDHLLQTETIDLACMCEGGLLQTKQTIDTNHISK